jgi:hypothetical protein
MANFVFNVAKGRVNELYRRVDGNDPANSALIMIPLLTSGLEADSVLIDADTFADVVAGATNEATAGGWGRKTLTDSDLAAQSPDDTNDRQDADIPDQTWPTVSAGQNVSKLVICYDADNTGGTDANLIPMTAHDFVVVTDGSDVIAQINSAGFYRAS